MAERAHCRSVCDEMHAGFANLRSALPMNLKARHPGFKVFTGAQPDIDRILAIWGECLAAYGGPYLFGARPTAADAMFAPVCTRFETYDVRLDPRARRYCRRGAGPRADAGVDRRRARGARGGRRARARDGVLTLTAAGRPPA